MHAEPCRLDSAAVLHIGRDETISGMIIRNSATTTQVARDLHFPRALQNCRLSSQQQSLSQALASTLRTADQNS